MNRSVTQPIDVPTVLAIHDLQIRRHGGSGGVRSLSCLEGCVASPWMSFVGEDLYPTLCEKAVRLGYEGLRSILLLMGISVRDWR